MSERDPMATLLIEHGMRLFARQGVGNTSIAAIEEAAGLPAGADVFFEHFDSKEAIVDAAVQDASGDSSAGAQLFGALEAFDLRSQAMFIARGAWMVCDRHRDLFLVLHREALDRGSDGGDDRSRWPPSGRGFVTEWLAARKASDGPPVRDPEALALVLTDALSNYWLQRQTYGVDPHGISEERFIEAWVDAAVGPPAA